MELLARKHQERASIATLVSDLWRESANLLRGEAELAKTELSQKIQSAGRGLAELAIGVAVLFAGILLLLFALVAGIAQLLPEEVGVWLSPLLVGVVVLIPGILLVLAGTRQLQAKQLKPEHAAQSIQRDAEIVKERVS